ncbi:unnamed protein product [Symbiodinium sp. CCMP2592]|nr:unnamed protein product [Symbiodinium sp. CCMP2592]
MSVALRPCSDSAGQRTFNAIAIRACEKASSTSQPRLPAGARNSGSNWRNAWAALESIPQKRLSSSKASLGGALVQGSWENAGALLRSLAAACLRLTTSTLNACAPTAWQRTVAMLRALPTLFVCTDVVTSLRAVAAFSREGRWSRALGIMSSAHPFAFQANVLSAGIGATPWAAALAVLATAAGAGVLVDHVCVNAAVTALAAGGVWHRAVDFLRDSLASNMVRFSTAIAACDASGHWAAAMRIWATMRCRRSDCDTICLNSLVSSCSKRWRWPLKLLGVGEAARIRRDVVSFSSAIRGLQGSQKWDHAAELLMHMARLEVPPNLVTRNVALAAQGSRGDWQQSLWLLAESKGEVSYRAAIDLCDLEGQEEQARLLLDEAHVSGTELSISFYPWAFGRLLLFEAGSTHDALFSALHVLQTSESRLPPQEVATLLWSSAMLSASNPLFSKLLCEQALDQMLGFSCEDLLLLAWGAAASALNFRLSLQIVDETMRRLAYDATFGGDAQVLLGVVWASHFAGVAGPGLQAAVAAQLQRAASRLEGPLVGLRDELGTRTSETLVAGREPALLHMGSVVAVAKPAGWEVWGGHHPRQLWQHLQAAEGLRHSILRDAEHGHGFVHRLDVPGSGLVLFACSYEAYYDLKLQLALGQLERRYTVLSHGLATTRNVTAHVHWKDRGPNGIRELPSVSGGRGKPCGTEIMLRAHGFKEGRALSLLTIRIRTGRRHQIRSHCAHIGHPSVYDGKYSTLDTSFGDAKWCEQNCLHRSQLIFRSQGRLREMLAPLPEPFAKLLQTLEKKTLEQSWGTL